MMEVKPAIIRYCQYQERSHAEVKNKLYELGCHTSMVNDIMVTLIEMNLLNEERFARAFARGKFRMLGWGREKIKMYLKQKQISDYCIRKALTEIDSVAYTAQLNKLAEKKWASLKSERSLPTKKQKLSSFLLQRGFERKLVIEAINNLIGK